MTDVSSRPHTTPTRLPVKTEPRIITLFFTHRWGPRRISYHLRVKRSAVERVLNRNQMPGLAHTDQATVLVVRRKLPVRYERTCRGIWSMWISSNRVESLMVGAGVGLVGTRLNTAARVLYAFAQHAREGVVPEGSGFFITLLMIIPSWRIPRF